MWQQIAIILIGIAVIAIIGYKIWQAIAKPKAYNPCEGCAGCALTNMQKENLSCKEAPKDSKDSPKGV